MTAKQLRTTLMRKLHVTAKNLHGWSHDELKAYAHEWGYGDSIGELTIDQLKGMLMLVEMDKPAPENHSYKPRYTEMMQKAFEFCANGTMNGMATEEQIRYSCVLYGAYCHFRKIPFEMWDKTFSAWLLKYWNTQFIGWCNQTKATKIISALEREIITTFGNEVFAQVTDKHWQDRGEKYKKYGGVR